MADGPLQSNFDEQHLIARVVQRDMTAFAQLYDRYAQTVYTLAVHLLGQADAEEVVQEVFLRVWRRVEQYDPSRGGFRVWLVAIARNECMDRLKLRNREKYLAALTEIDHLLAEIPDPRANTAELAIQGEQAQVIREALGCLPEEQRSAIVLAYFGGLSQSAISAHLGWPLGTVKKRIRLGLQKLRAALWRENEVLN